MPEGRPGGKAVWADLQGGTPRPLPEVDFDREMVVLVVGPGCCGDAEILSINRRGGELVSALTQNGTALCVLGDSPSTRSGSLASRSRCAST